MMKCKEDAIEEVLTVDYYLDDDEVENSRTNVEYWEV